MGALLPGGAPKLLLATKNLLGALLVKPLSLRRYPGGTENAIILATVRGSTPKRRAASRWLNPSIWTA